MLFQTLTAIPRSVWEAWFKIVESKNIKEKYGHTLMISLDACDPNQMSDKLRPYFERAHKDARDVFHSEIGINLDPLSNGGRPIVSYPNSLPDKQKKGFFGEVLCGILAQRLGTVCGKQWVVPAFLFRHHDTASQYLHRLYYGESVAKEIIGRTGNDFLAISTDANGNVNSVLVGEAKCHKNFSATISKKAHKDLSSEKVIPVNLSKLKNLIKELYPSQYQETIASIEEIVLKNKEHDLARTDLFLFLFENPKIKEYPPSRISQTAKEKDHTSNRPFQVFEIQLKSSGSMIKSLYKSLFITKGNSKKDVPSE